VQNASRVSFRNRAHQDDEMVNAYPIRDDGIAPDDQSGTWRSNLALRERRLSSRPHPRQAGCRDPHRCGERRHPQQSRLIDPVDIDMSYSNDDAMPGVSNWPPGTRGGGYAR
jgi:hypothetical protein